MRTQKKGRIAFAVCGSFCTLEAALAAAQQLTEQGWELLPVMSFAAKQDTRFGTGQFWQERLEALTGHTVLDTLQAVEPLGPKKLASALAIAPCTGATLARLAAGLSDTPVTLAAKRPATCPTLYGRSRWRQKAFCGWDARWWWAFPQTTGWARRGRTWPGSTSASTIILCPTGRMTPPTSPTA